jgi:hypothetical protein
MRAWLILLFLTASGCTLSAGDWFAELRASFTARYVARSDRDVGGGWQKLNTLYEVRMTRALVTIQDVELQDLGGGGTGTVFDPTHPPAGYSLCHNGHCHRDDGALIPYDEVIAGINSGGAAATQTVVTLPVGERDLLAPARSELQCEPGCGLGAANIQRARATATRIAFEGLVREGRMPARLTGEVAWRWEAALAADAPGLEPVQLDASAALPADNAHPPKVRLDLTMELGARVFDDIEWSALSQDVAGIDLSVAANSAGRDVAHENLAEAELTAVIQRSD